jgi:hypothetical protein
MQLVRAALPASELEFDGQLMQRADPVNTLYFPATHTEHVPPSGPDEPALQVHRIKAELPAIEKEFDGQAVHVTITETPTAVEYVPAPHSVHTADPVDALYFPATHAVHVPPSVPEKPPLQVQFIKAEFPAVEKEFVGQAVHVEAPTIIEYVPDPHSVHRAAPLDALYFPAAHSEQVPPSGPEKPALQAQLVKTELPAGEFEFVAVKSTPRTMASAIAEIAFVLRYSSTTNTPATSPLKYSLAEFWGLPIQDPETVLSAAASEAIRAELVALFTANSYSLVDARYLATAVSHVFCTITFSTST